MARPVLRAAGAAILAALLSAPVAEASESTGSEGTRPDGNGLDRVPHAGTDADPGQAVSGLWRAMSHAPGVQADSATLRALFHPDAVVFGSRLRDGASSLRRTGITDFLALFDTVSDTGFHECEIARSIETYDRFATVYSVVESRADPAARTPDFTGVNSLQLYRDVDGWKIVSLYYHVEAPGQPIPGASDRTGQCMR